MPKNLSEDKNITCSTPRHQQFCELLQNTNDGFITKKYKTVHIINTQHHQHQQQQQQQQQDNSKEYIIRTLKKKNRETFETLKVKGSTSIYIESSLT